MLQVVMYHYVRERTRDRFPRLRALDLHVFRDQVAALGQRYEVASLESALAYLRGEYHPSRDMCLLTFDDGLKDHFAQATPILAERGMQGLFFLTPSCQRDGRVLGVHKNHFLQAEMGFASYRETFLQQLAQIAPVPTETPSEQTLRATYRWDSLEEAAFKYLFNFQLPPAVRREVVDNMFRECLGDENSFARELYLDWDEARSMQADGMLLGGHTHAHRPLATLTEQEQAEDLAACREALRAMLGEQTYWPFSYPYGKLDSFQEHTVTLLRAMEFSCSFTSEAGSNGVGQDLYRLRRTDAKVAVSLLE
jgi:peptidoglycan/xylan/chitin deacetylase (PgdA/CDA1 family)